MKYTIRYRTFRAGGRTALIVTDEEGSAYLFSDGCLHCTMRGGQALARLLALLADAATWHPVPPVTPCSLPEMCALLELQPAIARAA